MPDLLPAERTDALPAEPSPAAHVARPRPAWLIALREFAVVVLGVLCALAAQAWWDGHQERGRERDYLRQLLADTRENERRLDEGIRTDSTSGTFTARALDALTSTTPPPPADSFVTWVINAGVGSNVQPLAGNYRALVGTGDLRLVRNDSLRAKLAAYAAFLESESERQQQFNQVVRSQTTTVGRVLPFLQRVFLGGVRSDDVDVQRMRADPEVGAVLFSLQASNTNRMSGLRNLRTETRNVRRALEAELGVSVSPPADSTGS